MSIKSRQPYSNRDGLIGRYSGQNEQLSVRVDPIQGDLDQEIDGLRAKVHSLKHVAELIDSETKTQSDLINQLENAMLKAQGGVKNTMKRLNRRIIQNRSNHLCHVILFVFACVLFVIIWSKFFRSR